MPDDGNNEKPSQLLMRCLEDFGEAEATIAIVVYRNSLGDLNWRASQGCFASEIVGMLRLAEKSIERDWIRGISGGDSKSGRR